MGNELFIESCKLFIQYSTIHGIPIIGRRNLHFLERLFWIIMIGIATGGAIALSLKNLERYYATPTVVSLQKDFRNWNNPFPSATGCFLQKADDDLVEELIESNWNINSSHPDFEYYSAFILAVANVSYTSMDAFQPFQNDARFQNVDMLEIAARVHPSLLKGSLVTFDSNRKPDWKLVVTEAGICFSMNSKFSNYFSYNFKGIEKLDPDPDKSIMRCHYLNGLCYARYDSDPNLPIKFYIHSFLDIIHATAEHPLEVHGSQELEINYRMQETIAADSLRKLSVGQRQCRFDDEPLTEEVPMYSTSVCYMMCRYRAVLRLCGCKPFFYHKLDGRICNASEMFNCVHKHKQYLTSPPMSIGCSCPQPCNIITYLPQLPKVTIWEYGYFDQRITFRWGLLPPTTKYHRDVLFGFEDLVVSFGGTMALFLGVSFISAVEIFLLICRVTLLAISPKCYVLFEIENKTEKFTSIAADQKEIVVVTKDDLKVERLYNKRK